MPTFTMWVLCCRDVLYRPNIYPIICLKSVCRSGDVRKVQVAILGRLPREMSQTDRILPRYFLSRVRVSIRPRIFLYAKKLQTIVARLAAVDRRSVADKQLNWNGHNPLSRRSSVPKAQRENVVAECSDHGSNPVQGTIFFSFLLFAINKAYF